MKRHVARVGTPLGRAAKGMIAQTTGVMGRKAAKGFGLVLAIPFLLLSTDQLAVGQEQVAQALKIRPISADVDIDEPAADEIEACKLERAADVIGVPGWILVDGSGRKLRQFLDTTGNNQLDTWSYFKNGMEVYRDLDTDGDNKKDQMRWFGTAGTRWGIDKNQDGRIETWKSISAEEAAAEIFYAIRDRDPDRFKAVLLSDAELQSLKLGDALAESLQSKLRDTNANATSVINGLTKISSQTEFVHFGSSTPFLLPNDFGKSGNQGEVMFYDHASAVFSEANGFGQLAIGTLVRVGDSWRAVELPAMMEEGKVVANGGLFIGAPRDADVATSAVASSEKMTKLFEEFEAVEKKLDGAGPGADRVPLEKQRLQILYQIILASNGEENRRNWIRQLADTATSAFESDQYPTGLTDLKELAGQLKKEGVNQDLDYIDYRSIMAQFSVQADGSTRERAEATETLQKNLEQFISDYPKSELSADGLMQLALYAEVNATSEKDLTKAIAYYDRVIENFPTSKAAGRARGAKTRLTCVGKPLKFVGNTLSNQKFDLSNPTLRGKVVVLHYWATWCDVCVADFDELQRLSSKYKSDLVVIGVNVDERETELRAFMEKNAKYRWPQLFDQGGITGSVLAEQLGVTTLPLTVLIDPKGNVVETQIGVGELDRDIQNLLDKS